MKGVVYTLEAIIGAVLLLVGIMSIYPIQQQREVRLSDAGYSCLRYLDQSGLLSHYAVNGLGTELNNSLRNCLPYVSEFKFRICASADCMETLPTDRNVYISSYMTAGENTYDRKLINLWVWLK